MQCIKPLIHYVGTSSRNRLWTVLIDGRVSAKLGARRIWAGRPAGKARSFFNSATKAPCGKMEKSERIKALILSAGGDILFEYTNSQLFINR
jgi:hypothetical protein